MTIVIKCYSTVIKEPISYSWKSWAACNISIPIFINADFKCIYYAFSRLVFIIKFTTFNSVQYCIISCDSTVRISTYVIVSLGWPGCIWSVEWTIVVEVNWAIVVNPKCNTCKGILSLCKNIPFLSDCCEKFVINTINSIWFRWHFTWTDSGIESISLVVWAGW